MSRPRNVLCATYWSFLQVPYLGKQEGGGGGGGGGCLAVSGPPIWVWMELFSIQGRREMGSGTEG